MKEVCGCLLCGVSIVVSIVSGLVQSDRPIVCSFV